MEKISLKPYVRELIYKSGEDNVHFDVLSYQGANGQEKMLGSLFVLGHIKYSEENLAYAVSLISSLAKREYYSERSFKEQNTKSAFERTLKKLNEVLDDFFQNKNFKLDIGLAAISGENIYISRLGKFKIALARDDKYIDILNNIDLFSKDVEGEKQFSNIISGKIRPNDKIFAYFPFRSITSREKQLNSIFIKESQEEFSKKIAHLAVNTNNFSCCGVHVDIREIKEIPISPLAYSKPIPSNQILEEKDKKLPASQTARETYDAELTSSLKGKDTQSQSNAQTQKTETNLEIERSRIIPAELLISERTNVLTSLMTSFKKLVSIGKLGNRARQRGFIMMATIILVPILIIILFKNDSSANKSALKQAGENLKLAQSHITQSNLKDARSLLQASLISLAGLSGKKADNSKQQINQVLDSLDRTSNKQPTLFSDPLTLNQDFKASFIVALNDRANTIDADGTIFAIAQNEISRLDQFKITPRFVFSFPSWIVVFNGSDALGVYNPESKKINTYSLKDPASATDAVLYENNLYTLSGHTIYKYADAITGGVKRGVWINDDSSSNLISMAADGNIFTLTSDGKLLKYFKNKKVSESDLQLVPAPDSRIFTYKDAVFIYLADKINKRVYIFDKTNGLLKTSYKLDAAGTISDISFSPNGTIWILSADNKVWTIQ